MKTFKELEIKSSKQNLINLIDKIKNLKIKDYNIEKTKSDEYAKMIGKNLNEVLTIKTTVIKDKPAYVWLVIHNDILKITNITPLKSGQLSKNQYNEILDNVYNDLIKPNINDAYKIKITTDTKTIEDYAGKEVAEKLEKWYNLANKSTLNTNHYDFERWADFLITAHKHRSPLTPNQLEIYLTEEKGLSDDELVNKIIIDYEYGRDLLKEYDKHR